jgi:glycosyltransferase involved in cell wall biosynthesis
LLREVPIQTHVERTFALDTARHLRVLGRYPAALARPDRWMSWFWSAVPVGLRLIRRFQPTAIWSTYPIATAHLIGAQLHRRSGLPWIADFRDPMAQTGYPADPRTWRAFKDIEERTVANAKRVVFVTPGAMNMYAARYPTTPRENFVAIENGYDEALFHDAEQKMTERGPLHPERITLLHSGVVYPSERDPTALMAALARLKGRRVVDAGSFCLRFRGPVHDELLRRLARESGVEELVEILSPIPYGIALAEMMRADGLLVMQAANCNEQIPAKLYEYLRAQRPILGLADPMGDTAQAMSSAGVEHIAKLEDTASVERSLEAFLNGLRSGRARLPDARVVAGASRAARTEQLVRVLDSALAQRSSG